MDAPPPLPAPTPEHFAAPAGPRPGEAGVVSVGEARAYAPEPRWYRLPDESWAMIRAEYLAGATAKQLAVKWGVSPTSVYRHACQDGFTKARRGEAVNLEAVTRFAAQAAAAEARAGVQAQAESQAQAAAEAVTREREAEAVPAEAAARLLRRAAAAALAGRLDAAQSLLKLAEGLARAAAAARSASSSARDEAPRWFDPEDSDEDEFDGRPAAVQREEADARRAHVQALRDKLEMRVAEVFADETERRASAAERRAAQAFG